MFSSQFLAMAAMLASMLFYQLSASFAKYLFQVLDATTVTTLRLVFASVLVFLMLRSWRVLYKLKFVQWQDFLLYSTSICVMNLLFYHALVLLPQGMAVGLEFVGPLGLALCAIKHKIDTIWVILAIIGVMLMMPWSGYQQVSWLGILYALGAGLCWAIYIFYGQRVVRQNLGLHSLTLALGVSALIMLPIGLLNNAQAVLNVQFWGYAVALALLATAIPYALDLYALKYLTRLSYGTFTSLAPALAALAGVVLLDEYLSMLQWLALACIMIASVAVTFRNYQQAKQPVN